MLTSTKFLLATGWLIFITILFFLPGSALPSDDWMSKIWFDKWVHIGFFAILTYLWITALSAKGAALMYLIFSAIAYGYLVEICQDRFVAQRAFDWGDVAADAIGIIAATVLYRYKKNRPL